MSGQGLFEDLKNVGCLEGVDYIDTVVKNTIYKARYEDRDVIVKLIHYDKVKWAELDSFWERYGDNPEEFYDIILYNYSRLSELDIGPKLYKHEICGDYLILVMEFIRYKVEPDMDQEVYDSVSRTINRMHEAGIIHGDLHAGNMGLTDELIPKFIDLETVFYLNDVDDIAQEWMMHGFDIDSIYEFIEEEKNNFMWTLDINA